MYLSHCGVLILLCGICSALKLLVGLEIDAARFFSRRSHDNTLQLVSTLLSLSRSDIEIDIVACLHSSRGMVNNPQILDFVRNNNISLFFAASQFPSLCILDSPEINLYDNVIQVNTNSNVSLLQLEGIFESNYVHDDVTMFHLRNPACVAQEVHISCPTNSENTCNTYEALQSATQLCDTSYTAPSTSSPLSFTRASSVTYHTSGPCHMWWPLHHSEVFVFKDSRKQTEPIILHCRHDEILSDALIAVIEQTGMPKPIISAISLRSVSISNALQLMVSISTPPSAQYIKLIISICDERLLTTSVSHTSCISTFNVSQRIIWSDSITRATLPPLMLPMQATLTTRDTFGYVLNMMRIGGTFVEIGVHKASYSSLMLSQWNGHRYVLVDPWVVQDAEEYVDVLNVQSVEVVDRIYNEALENVAPYKDRIAVIRDTSVHAAALIMNNSVDVVYIDGLHHYRGVLDDIEAWWPKLRTGGILAGHDYMLVAEGQTIFTVKPAVDEFVRKMGLSLFQTHDSYSTWFVFKF